MATNKQSLCAIYAALYNIDIDKEIYKFLINQIQLEDMIPTDKFFIFYFVLLQIFLRKKGSSVYPLMMMMIAPNSLVRQKQGEKEEEEAGIRRKAGPTGTPTPDADAPIVQTR